ncbi:hypothetical protein JCM6882_007912 [Rhodosporidiobolus microsporus]
MELSSVTMNASQTRSGGGQIRARPNLLPSPLPHIILHGVELAYSPSLTMLGTVLDEHLTFAAHRAACVAKASKALQAVALLSRARAGLAPRWVRQLVMAVVEPRLSRMAELWFEGGEGGVSRAYQGVWKDAARQVCGGYRSAARVPLEVEANLMPLDLVLRSHQFRLALRALSATARHPLAPLTSLARPARVRKHPSPLHRALHAFPSLLPPSLQVEPIVPSPLPPWAATPAHSTLIAPSKEEAVVANSLPPDALLGYSDGSLLEGLADSVGGEGEGARLTVSAATSLVQQLHSPSLTLLIDNQALLLCPADPSPSPGQQQRLALRAALLALLAAAPWVVVVLMWCPGHEGVDGNERADALAKEAAEEGRRREEARRVYAGGGADAGGLRGRSRTVGRAAVLFRASQGSQALLSSEGSEWGGGEGETSGTWARRAATRLAHRLAVQQPPQPLQGEVEGGEGLPKSLSALKQAQREERLHQQHPQQHHQRLPPLPSRLSRRHRRPPPSLAGRCLSRLYNSLPAV